MLVMVRQDLVRNVCSSWLHPHMKLELMHANRDRDPEALLTVQQSHQWDSGKSLSTVQLFQLCRVDKKLILKGKKKRRPLVSACSELIVLCVSEQKPDGSLSAGDFNLETNATGFTCRVQNFSYTISIFRSSPLCFCSCDLCMHHSDRSV